MRSSQPSTTPSRSRRRSLKEGVRWPKDEPNFGRVEIFPGFRRKPLKTCDPGASFPHLFRIFSHFSAFFPPKWMRQKAKIGGFLRQRPPFSWNGTRAADKIQTVLVGRPDPVGAGRQRNKRPILADRKSDGLPVGRLSRSLAGLQVCAVALSNSGISGAASDDEAGASRPTCARGPNSAQAKRRSAKLPADGRSLTPPVAFAAIEETRKGGTP